MMRNGAVLACLIALLPACAGKPLVRTETVDVKVPVAVALPSALTKPVDDMPVPTPLTNDGLAGVAEGEKCRKIAANCQIEKIEDAQPGDPRWPVKWCKRYSDVCGGGK